MLHLTVIGIVCAVSAPGEGTAFIGRKHNGSNIFCHFDEGRQNVAKVSLPSVDNVDVHNSSNCAKQKVTNRTSSFFYDYVIKQYQNSKNSSCSIMENVFLEKKKKLRPNVDFVYKKRNLLWTENKEKLLTETIRPSTEIPNCQAVRPLVKKCRRKKCKVKKYKSNTCKMKLGETVMKKPMQMENKGDLNCQERKKFLRFIKQKPEKPTLNQRHLDTVEVNEELDINKRIDKIVKEVALENQRKEEYSKGFRNPLVKGDNRNQISSSDDKQKADDSFSLLSLIKKIFSFSKDSFNAKKCDSEKAVNSNSVNNEENTVAVAEKVPAFSSSNDFKTTRLKRNLYDSYGYFDKPTSMSRNNFILQPHLHNSGFMAKRRSLYPPTVQKVFSRNGRKRKRRFRRIKSKFRRPYRTWENKPFSRKFNLKKQNIHDTRPKRYEKRADKSSGKLTTQEEDNITRFSSTHSEISKITEKTCSSSLVKTTKQTAEEKTEKISVKGDDGKTTENSVRSTLSLSEGSTTENLITVATTQKDENLLPDHTLEKPFLERDFRNERFENYKPNSDFDSYDTGFDPITDFPSIVGDRFRQSRRFKYELPDDEFLNPFRFLKIRHALRNYLIHNNVWGPSKRNLSFDRIKRCGAKGCSLPRKCWRSAPLLCVPYIKKGQEDVLKYLIRIMQHMMGKPFPPKLDIFEKTKFKPFPRRESHHPCECIPEEEIFEYNCPNAQPCPMICPSIMPPCPSAMPPCPPAMPPCPPVMPSCPLAMPPCPLPTNPCRFSNCPIVSRPCAVPPFPYAAKLNPDAIKPSSYANINAPRQYLGPPPSLWPSNVPFYIPRAEQMVEQNPAQFMYQGKLPTATPQSVLPTPVPPIPFLRPPVTSINANNAVPNSSLASSIKASVPEHNTSANASVAPDVNILPSQTASSTVEAELAEGNSKGSSSSTKSACALYVSNSPIGQEEYFSYTAVPYHPDHGCSTQTSQYLETVPPMPINQQLINPTPNYNALNPQKIRYETCYAKSENVSPNIQPRIQWPTTNSMPMTETSIYQSKIKEFPKNYKMDSPSQINPSQYAQMRKEDRNRKLEWNKNYRKNLGKTLQYEDYSLNERSLQGPEMNFDNPQKRLFRMKHRKIQKPNMKPSEFFSPYDYYFYEKYPQLKENDKNALKYGRYSMPRVFWKDYGRKLRALNNPNSLVRRKRGDDYYFGSDNLNTYNDYLDDSNYEDENLIKPMKTNRKISDKYFPDTGWTPPSYDMFSELAKAVPHFNFTTPSFEITTSAFGLKDSFANLDQSQTVSTPEMSKYDADGNTENKFFKEDNSDFFVTSSNQATSTSELYETDRESFTQSIATTVTEFEANDQDTTTDRKKFGKPSFFQMNSKAVQNPKNSKKDEIKDENELDENEDLEYADEGQIPTTLKTATIVKGPKKSMTKPSPKGYSKVFPDSFEDDLNEALAMSTAGTTARTYIENRTALLSSTPKPDFRLQLLAVCEGYLEVVKLIKTQNQTLGEDLDADLARYCENIIYQSFNSQSEKPKKVEASESSSQTGTKEAEAIEDPSKNTSKLKSGSIARTDSSKEFSEAQFRDKIVAEMLKNSLCDRKFSEEKNESCKTTLKKNNDNDETIIKDLKSTTGIAETETTKSTETTEISVKIKKRKKKKNNWLLSNIRAKKQKRRRRKEETEEKSLKKGTPKEQTELIEILKKRKKALLTWLFNSKNQGNSDESQETEYFDDEDLIVPETDPSLDSGTIKPKRGEKRSGTTKKYLTFVNASIFPVYAKQYGYDKGGELREVEVLWRKINEKTHEERILKNLSVLALLMPLTNPPSSNPQEIKLVGNSGYENDDSPDTEMKRESKLSLGDPELAEMHDKTSSTVLTLSEIKGANDINTTPCTDISAKLTQKNATHTYIKKPDPSSIVGAPPNTTKIRPNTTRKTSHKMEVAKDIFQEYTIEFLNYAVYILPIMLTILFLFCCLCCGLHILKTQQSLKKYRKMKKTFSTDDTSDTTEESGRHSKKRKRDDRCKRKTSEVLTNQKGQRKFWNVLKLPSKANKQFDDESGQAERKKTILRFLTDNGEKKDHESDVSHGVRRKKRDDDCYKTDDHSEAAERRELIALLEELKKIETEHAGEKKEVKSVHVQYMTQEDDDSVFQRPDVFYPYQKNVFGMPKGYSFYSKPFPCRPIDPDPANVKDYELYEDVNELTELLPCECNYLIKKNDYLRHCDFRINQPGRCERFFKIFRDSGVSHNGPFKEKNFMKNESENRSFIFNKYRSISTDTSEEFMGVTQKSAGTEVKLMDNASPLTLPPQKNAGLVEEVDDLKRQLNNKKKYVRLKDDGVLCRL